MSIYKQASRQKLRIPTKVGSLTVEQVWGLSLPQLDELAVSLEENLEKSSRKSYLTEVSSQNQTTKLLFDIVLDILTTKLSEEQFATQQREIKEHNQKIMAMIAEDDEKELRNLSREEKLKLLK